MRKIRQKRITDSLIVAGVLLLILCLAYAGDYYPVTDEAAAMSETDTVKIRETENGYLYDGPGEDTALIFYPGAKVQDISYAVLLKELAANGIDCFLVHMPCNLALFGVNSADEIIETYGYEHWYLAGHSLGGAMAAVYASKNSETLDGLIFLAAYSTKDLSETDLNILLLYGSEDKVVNREKIKEGRNFMPDTYEEYCIEGGNHAQYGDYGAQKGDGTAKIPAEEQQRIAAEKIEELCLDSQLGE